MFPSFFRSGSAFAQARLWVVVFAVTSLYGGYAVAQDASAPDELVLSNGDTLHGKLLDEADGAVTFQTEALGKVKVKWANIKELHTSGNFAVLDKTVKIHGKKSAGKIPVGTIDATSQSVTVHPEKGTAPGPIPTANAAYIVDEKTLDKQAYHEPGFLTGWTGAATAGVTIVEATQNQSTESGSIGLMRTVPGVAWLKPRNRTGVDFSGSFGKITAPGATPIKTAIYHADGERDEYFSTRFFGLAQAAFDHNFSQGLALQSLYGGGIGFTALKNAKQELDVKATIQYEKQEFLATPPAPASPSQNLIGSTLSADYAGKWKLFTLVQEFAFIPAYNKPHDYSANETDTVTFPTYKNLGFSLGTLDSYLNDPPASTPPTKRNSFQFTMGFTYAIKSKY